MNRKGIEFILLQVEPDRWSWQFWINEVATSGKTETRLKEMAVRRVEQRIDRVLRKQDLPRGMPAAAARQIERK
jgi:hypothetical protein